MRTQSHYPHIALATFLVFIAVPVVGMAQSGSRTNPAAGSGSRSTPPPTRTALPLALEGYCPVSIAKMHKWVRGNPSYRVDFDGRTYLMADARGMEMFRAHPEQFTPALGGDCIVAFKDLGKRVAGNIRHAAFHKDRLFLFANAQAQQRFLARPATYENADLAYGGRCVVCQVNMQQTMAGKPELTTVYHGMRYQFVGAAQQKEFLAHPAKYAVPNRPNPPAGSGRAVGTPAGSGSGSGGR